jgi:hypothetical protein
MMSDFKEVPSDVDGASCPSRCSTDQYIPRTDDELPISDEWFRDNWPEEHREDNYAVECPVGWFEVSLYGEDCFSFHLSGYAWDGERLKTRGDVRRLLWYLESELIP